MVQLLVAAAICAVASVAVARLPLPSLAPRARWWRAVPATPKVDPGAVGYAVGQIRKGRKGAVTVLRVGRGGGDSDLWIGVAGAADPERAAAEIAEAAGCQPGPEEQLPMMRSDWRWFYSTVWSLAGDYDRFPEQRLVDSRPGGDVSRFADLANQRLGADDVLMITARFTRTGETMNAAALSTAEAAAAGWNDVPPPTRPHRPAPHPLSAWLAGLAVVLGVLPIVMWGIDGHGVAEAWIGGVIAAAGGYGMLAAYRYSPVVARAIEGRGVRVPKRAPLRMRLGSRDEAAPQPARLAVGLLAGWAGGGERTALIAEARMAPSAVIEPAELLIGSDSGGRDCYMTDRDRQWGIIIFGDPGMGKTTWARNILAADAKAIASGAARRSIVLIETKGEGALAAAELLRHHGVEPVIVNVARADGPRLELIDWSQPARSARTITEAMKYAYGPGEIFESSAEVLNAVFTASIAAGRDHDALAQLGYNGLPNIMELSSWMIGGDPDHHPIGSVTAALRHLPEYSAVARYTEHLGKYKQENVLEAPRNKLSGQMFARGLWEAGRRRTVTFRTILEGHHALVLNLGPIAGDTGYTKLTSHRCASMALYLLWDEIMLTCDSWQEQGRSVALYSDELHALAGTGGDIEVVGNIAAEGRSRGVMAVFATQWPDQLPEAARLGVTSYGTRAYFRVDNADVADYAARDLGDSIAPAELRNLPVGQCAARVRRDEVAQAVFTLHPAAL